METNSLKDTVYALMITGKTPHHEQLAINAVKSFTQQSYTNTVLIIINDGDYKVTDTVHDFRIKEVVIPKDPKNTLGDLRNMSLDMVPEGDIWIQWDDDDWHGPERIAEQAEVILNGETACCLQSQVKYCFSKNCAWETKAPLIEGTISARKNSKIKYPSQRLAEDSVFIQNYLRSGNLRTLCNKPSMYLRFIHGNNSWDDDHFHLSKRQPNTFLISDEEKQYLGEILKKHYAFDIESGLYTNK